MSTNPFTFGSMLNDPNKFVGRRAELELIIARLNGSQPQGSAIVGPRRIGKSSLLYYLAHSREGKDQSLPLDDNLQVFYISAAAGNCRIPEQFRLTVVMKLIGSNQRMIDIHENKRPDYFHEITNHGQSCSWATAREVLEKMPFHPVICLDEFEALLLNDAFDDSFFNALRNWANEGLLSWVTASAKPLQDILEYNNLTSPFFNLLATVPLGELTDTEANNLLKLADTTSHAFTDSEKRMVKRLAGKHPYHLQIVAWRFWEMRRTTRALRKKAGRTEEEGQANRSRESILWDFLCQQPEPPASCTRGSNRFKLYVVSLPVIIVLIAMLSWFVLTQSSKPFVWENLVQFGGGLGGLMVLVIFLALMFGAAWMGLQLADIRHNLWERP